MFPFPLFGAPSFKVREECTHTYIRKFVYMYVIWRYSFYRNSAAGIQKKCVCLRKRSTVGDVRPKRLRMWRRYVSLSLSRSLSLSLPCLCLYGSLRLAVLHLLLCPYQCLSVCVGLCSCVCVSNSSVSLCVCCCLCTHTRQEPSDVKSDVGYDSLVPIVTWLNMWSNPPKCQTGHDSLVCVTWLNM